jgi:hypothetical protein
MGELARLALSRSLGPGAGALVGHGHKVVQTTASDGVQEAFSVPASKGKRLPPD